MLSDGWDARLALGFATRGARTELTERRHHGPLRVQRPFHPEANGTCHVYVLHPPGGVVGGDRLDLHAQVAAGGRALLTTPAATKLYRSAGPRSDVRQTLSVAAGACLEWLPQEAIAYDAAEVELCTRVELQVGGRFVGWEILCLGRPASNERFERGSVVQRIEIVREGALVYRERGCYRGGGEVLRAAWGLQGQPVTASLVCAGRDLAGWLEPLRAALATVAAPALAAASCMGEITVVRYLGPSTEQAKDCFLRAWEILRPALCEQPACAPRIWAT